ncbi:MAG: tRNA pseudouridine(55) synthase TruB [Desulfamplus sp.]|nr:tRNA pseudouridine(55) synthase TruB [Desulfamplus sp.]
MTKDGILAIDKPEGISSAAVVARIKKKLGVKKVGHTGTLDPFATGLMLCGINKGTRLSQFFLGSSKCYAAEVILGMETDTQDCTGHIMKQCAPGVVNCLSDEMIVAAIDNFKGSMMQQPPVYSALKHKGKPLYKLAREGQPVQKPPRRIEIYSIVLKKIKKNQRPETSTQTSSIAGTISDTDSVSSLFNCLSITFEVHCSSGTYIRTLAHDIGQRLGCGGTLFSLRRTQTCVFSIDNAISLGEFEMLDQNEAFNRIIPMAQAIPFMPMVQADETLMERIRFGRTFMLPVQLSDYNNNTYIRVVDSHGELAAIVKYDITLDKYDYCCVFAN